MVFLPLERLISINIPGLVIVSPFILNIKGAVHQFSFLSMSYIFPDMGRVFRHYRIPTLPFRISAASRVCRLIASRTAKPNKEHRGGGPTEIREGRMEGEECSLLRAVMSQRDAHQLRKARATARNKAVSGGGGGWSDNVMPTGAMACAALIRVKIVSCPVEGAFGEEGK